MPGVSAAQEESEWDMKKAIRTAAALLLICATAFSVTFVSSRPSGAAALDGASDVQSAGIEAQAQQVVSDWESYPGGLYAPEDFAAGAAGPPVEWENQYGEGASAGTHRMLLRLPAGELTAIRFRSIDYATKIYINGAPMGDVGLVGATKETTTPRVGYCFFVFTPETEESEIILQYANFHHRRGGHPPELTVGAPDALLQLAQEDTLSQALVTGLLLTAFLYHIAMFFLCGRRRSFLYFALCCLTFAIRALLPMFILFLPDYNWMMIRLEYLFMFSGAALLILFFRTLFPALFSSRVLRTAAGLLVGYNVIVIFTAPAFFSRLLSVIQPLCLLAVLYITAKLGAALKTGGRIVSLAFSGIAFFLITAINDVLYLNKLPSAGQNLMPVGIVVFTLAYMIILSIEFAENERRLEAARIREESIRAERNALEQINRMKTEFFQNMSHDLKTPLTVISTDVYNAADQLDFEMDVEDMRQSLKNAQGEIMRISRMVDGAMKISAVQEQTVYMEAMDMAPILRSGAEACRSILEQHGNALALDIPAALPPVNGSADMIVQVLLNLLSNANHHTRNGEIAVTASEEGARSG